MAGRQKASTAESIAQRSGLQAERTDLSWTRSSLAFLINGSLLLTRRELSAPSTIHWIGAAIALGLILFTARMAFRRRRDLAARPLPEPLAAPVALGLLGAGTMVLGLVTLVVVVVG